MKDFSDTRCMIKLSPMLAGARALAQPAPVLGSLIERGFSRHIAEKIALMRPDVAEQILNTPRGAQLSPPEGYAAYFSRFTKSAVWINDATPATFYRGLAGAAEEFNPAFGSLSQGSMIFVTESLKEAMRYARGSAGSVVEFQVPRFMVASPLSLPGRAIQIQAGHPVLLTHMVPDLRPFVSGLANGSIQGADRPFAFTPY